jgi:hypothetical protein
LGSHAAVVSCAQHNGHLDVDAVCLRACSGRPGDPSHPGTAGAPSFPCCVFSNRLFWRVYSSGFGGGNFFQFSDTLRRNTYLEPESVLMLAILEDAIYCLQKHATCARGRNRRLFDETVNWVHTQDDEWLFSFENVCETVGLNAGRLCRSLLEMVAGGYRVKRTALYSPAHGHRSGQLRARG